ncbi:unannotated protein [freshwater metagenome]|uniref:Unannotated protein n=1 Tax=freshwater metagenome TaxID=449393 RepID=A0A6J5ZQT2_9ZZZZ
MFDFRYHAVSLAAVLVALAVGVLLGVAIGDAGLVSSAEKQVRSSLRDDVRGAQAKEQEATDLLKAEERYSQASYPFVVGGRLQGAKVGLLFLGEPDEAIAADVRAALEGSGGALRGTLAVNEPPDTAALAASAPAGRYAQLDQDPKLLGSFGRSIGRQMILGGDLLRSEANALFSTRAGGLGPFDAIVVVRIPRNLTGEAATNTNLLEDGLMAGLTKTRSSIVGVQSTTTQPTQVSWYRTRGLSSVDNIDLTAGQAALVFALAGARGSFGSGPDAGGLLPGPELAAR